MFSNQLDVATTERLIDRLERRAKDEVFNRLFDQYVEKVHFPEKGLTLKIGCGTEAMARVLVYKENFSGKVIDIDQSEAFIEAALGFSASEGLNDRITFEVRDAHDLNFEDESFDVVILHTLVSHVTNTDALLHEVARVIRKGGTVAIFDLCVC